MAHLYQNNQNSGGPPGYSSGYGGMNPPGPPTMQGHAPPPAPGNFAPPPAPGGYAPPPSGGFAPPPAPGNFGPPAMQGYGQPPAPSSYNQPPAMQGYNQGPPAAPVPSQGGLYGGYNAMPPPATPSPPSSFNNKYPAPPGGLPTSSGPPTGAPPSYGQYASPPTTNTAPKAMPPPKSNVQFFSVGGTSAQPSPSIPAGPPSNSLSAPPGAMSLPPGAALPPPDHAAPASYNPGQYAGFPSSNLASPDFHQPQSAPLPGGFDQSATLTSPDAAQAQGILPSIDDMDLSIQCNPAFLKATVSKIINQQNVAASSKTPIGVICQPMAGDIGCNNDAVDVVDFGSTGIIRCKRCRTYINPFVSWIDNGRRWRCNICGMQNDVPTTYFSHLDQNGQRRDKNQRPELSKCSVEFVAPGDYMVRPPQPPVYFFVIDVTTTAGNCGMLPSLVNGIKRALDELPGTPRTQIGFITFDTCIHFYNLKSTLKSPQMLVVSDINDVIMPSPDDLLVNLAESRSLVDALLDSLPSMFQNNVHMSSCTGSALQAAKRVMQHIGGKLLLFQTGLPTLGEGILKPRDNPRMLGTDKEHMLLNAEDQWYKNNAIDFSRLQISVDIFLFSNQYTDVATFASLSRYTAGDCYYYPSFFAARDGIKFESELYHNLTRATAFEAVMRIRATRGLRITGFYGNFFIRGTDLLALPNCNSDSTFGFELAYDEPMLNASAITVQAALLYTTSSGERRIRVHSMVIPVTQSLPDMLNTLDIDAAVNLTLKQCVEVALKTGFENARQRVHQICIDVLRSCKNNYQKDVPVALQLLPLYCMSMLKNLALRGGNDVRLDERAFYHSLLMNMNTEQSKVFIYPRMFLIHDMELNAGTPSDNSDDGTTAGPNRVKLPTILNLSHERLSSDGVYLLENGYEMFMWLGRQANSAVLQALFGVTSVEGIDVSTLEIQKDSSDFSHRVHNVIEALRADQQSHYMQLHYIREGDGYPEAYFSRYLVEDRANFNGGTYSYMEYHALVSRQIAGGM